MPKIEHEYRYDEIIIGNDHLSALRAYTERTPLISTLNEPPLFHETVDDEIVREFNLPNSSMRALWETLRFQLSLAGLMPLSDKVSSINIEEGLIRVSTKNDKLVKVGYNKLYVFDDEKLSGIEDRLKTSAKVYKVLDWFDVKSGAKHNHDCLRGDSDFIKEIHFYDSQRVEGRHGLKDLVAISYLTMEQINDFDYSGLHARYRIVDAMEKAGIKGRKNGKDPNDKTKFRFRSIKLGPNKREIRTFEKNKYKSDSKIAFC